MKALERCHVFPKTASKRDKLIWLQKYFNFTPHNSATIFLQAPARHVRTSPHLHGPRRGWHEPTPGQRHAFLPRLVVQAGTHKLDNGLPFFRLVSQG